MSFWGYVIYFLVVSIIAYYAAVRAQRSVDRAPESPMQPSINQGERVRVLFGTREVSDPKVVWMGPTTAYAIKK
jgi:hypothetical protein